MSNKSFTRVVHKINSASYHSKWHSTCTHTHTHTHTCTHTQPLSHSHTHTHCGTITHTHTLWHNHTHTKTDTPHEGRVCRERKALLKKASSHSNQVTLNRNQESTVSRVEVEVEVGMGVGWGGGAGPYARCQLCRFSILWVGLLVHSLDDVALQITNKKPVQTHHKLDNTCNI